jgi:hypothetical protein
MNKSEVEYTMKKTKKIVRKILKFIVIISILVAYEFGIVIYNHLNERMYNVLQYVPGTATIVEADKYAEDLEKKGYLRQANLVRTMSLKMNELKNEGDTSICNFPLLGKVVFETSVRGKAMSLEEIYNVLEDNNTYITEFCKEYDIPKEIFVSILFREMYCLSYADLVQNKSLNVVNEKSTIGLGQISIKMAKKSEKVILKQERSNEEIYKDLITDKGNIKNCAILLKYYQKVLKIDELNEETSKKLFKKYNGNIIYANSLYEYMYIFQEFYLAGGFDEAEDEFQTAFSY